MAANPSGGPGGRGSAAPLLLVLLLVIAILAFWAWSAHPPSTPNPARAGLPKTLPNAAPPPAK